MQWKLLVGCFVVPTLASQPAEADGIIYRLPKDGTQVLYRVDGSEVDGDDGDKESFRGTLTLSSVGVETVKGKTCRWIEIRHTWQNVTRGDKDDRVRILKCLIPEEHLGKGKTPSKHVLRGWRVAFRGSVGKGKPYPLRRSDGSIRLGQPGGILLSGPAAKPEMLKAKEIATKLGKFTCFGVRSRFEVEAGRVGKVRFTFTVWRHKEVPFGVVRFEVQGKEPDGDVVTMSGTIQQKADGAVSELPKSR